jgi:hypothetical protein
MSATRVNPPLASTAIFNDAVSGPKSIQLPLFASSMRALASEDALWRRCPDCASATMLAFASLRLSLTWVPSAVVSVDFAGSTKEKSTSLSSLGSGPRRISRWSKASWASSLPRMWIDRRAWLITATAPAPSCLTSYGSEPSQLTTPFVFASSPPRNRSISALSGSDPASQAHAGAAKHTAIPAATIIALNCTRISMSLSPRCGAQHCRLVVFGTQYLKRWGR